MSREQDDMMRLLEVQKSQLNQESEQMRNYMKDFMDKMLSMQDNVAKQNNVHAAEFGRKSQGYGPQNQMEMQQIGNVFYNLLNMVGSQQRDERIIGLSNDLREQI
jgi:peptidoglycan hydrolase CwlO-like protein